MSTANPYKFPVDVLGALGSREKNPYKAIIKLYNLTALECPDCILELEEAKEIHTDVVDRKDVKNVVLDVAKQMTK